MLIAKLRVSRLVPHEYMLIIHLSRTTKREHKTSRWQASGHLQGRHADAAAAAAAALHRVGAVGAVGAVGECPFELHLAAEALEELGGEPRAALLVGEDAKNMARLCEAAAKEARARIRGCASDKVKKGFLGGRM
eukprot:1374928-Pleurochrysis_carterae.AAC.1